MGNLFVKEKFLSIFKSVLNIIILFFDRWCPMNKRLICAIIVGAAIAVSITWWQKNVHTPTISIDMRMLSGMNNVIPLAVIGSGPAGLSAALYGARGKTYTVVFEGKKPGGQLTGTSYVENWPGIKKMLGNDIINGLREQAQSFGAKTIHDTIVKADFSRWPFELTTEDGIKVHALTVIIATGANPRKLGVQGEEEFWGRGVTTCAICDAPFYQDSDVVVVGGGDSAVEEALQLAPYAKNITILVRGTAMRASAAMQDKLKEYKNISVRYETSIKAIKGDAKHVNAIDVATKDQTMTMPIDGVFLAIGHKPNTQIFKDIITLNDHGYIVLKPQHDHEQMTSVAGVFAAGDVADYHYRQAGVAAGDGIRAALDALEFLREHNFTESLAVEYASQFFDPRSQERLPLEHISTQKEFNQRVLQSPVPVILDFYTQYCPTCLQMLPIVEQIAAQFKNRATFYKVDALAFKELAAELVIPTVPMLIVFKDGKLVARSKEIMNRAQLQEFVEKFV